MTNLELVLNMLAETATTEISEKRNPTTFPQNKQVAHEEALLPVAPEKTSIQNRPRCHHAQKCEGLEANQIKTSCFSDRARSI